MKAIPFFLFLMLAGFLLKAQFVEDFSDGNIDSNPIWNGNTADFNVINGELQLSNASPSSSNNFSYLAVKAPTSIDTFTVWRFYVRLNFSPSTSNRLRIYLSSNQPNLSAPLNGYFIQIGEGGANDAIELFRQDGEQITSLGSGSLGAVASQPAIATVEVRRTEAGKWTILADYSGGNALVEEFITEDTIHSNGKYFGFLCQYTSSRANSFFFDNIFIDPLFIDRTAPTLQTITVNSSNNIRLSFDEALDSTSAVNLNNYIINKGIGTPQNAVFDKDQPTSVDLFLTSELISTIEYTLTVMGVKDPDQNAITSESRNFIFYDIQSAESGDLIVSEIFADPSPSRGLPDGEFFEIYNRSEKVLQLNDLLINSGGTPQLLPEYLLLPGEYVCICDDSDLEAFQLWGPSIAVRTLPSLSNNDNIEINKNDGTLIYSLSYEQDWYDVDSLSKGGVSLEIIYPEGPFDCPSNWIGSRNSFGGTPGLINSAINILPENLAPQLSSISVEDEFEIRIQFNEVMDQKSVLASEAYSISSNIIIEEIVPGIENEIIIFLNTPLQPGQAYTLSLNNSISDCIGNSIGQGQTLVFGLPEEALTGDVLINELLFNPMTGGKDFLEIYNNSEKVINLKGWLLQNTLKKDGNTLETFDQNLLFFPNEYLVISADPNDILSKYSVPMPNRLVRNDLPTLDSKEGNITILRPDSILIDAFDYDESLHFSLLENKKGVSLERLSFEQSSQSRGNWHSASESVGFATPTGPNSQIIAPTSNLQELVTIDNPRFSPDNDGFEDILLVQINPDRPGYVANLKIFDAQGRLVRDLIKNSLLGNTGLYKWDGLTNENNKARIGPYVIWIELFDPNGEVIREKKTVVVAGKL